MYAVIKTGGKQYRVQPGDVLVVEKLDGDVGAEVKLDQVLMVGNGEDVTVGAPLVDGAAVTATLIETRKGDKIKVFKKIRRQGYRRTQGHRQFESVLRVTSIAGAGSTENWSGTVNLAPKALLDAKARNLPDAIAAASGGREAFAAAPVAEDAPAKPAAKKAAPKAKKPAAEADQAEGA